MKKNASEKSGLVQGVVKKQTMTPWETETLDYRWRHYKQANAVRKYMLI